MHNIPNTILYHSDTNLYINNILQYENNNTNQRQPKNQINIFNPPIVNMLTSRNPTTNRIYAKTVSNLHPNINTLYYCTTYINRVIYKSILLPKCSIQSKHATLIRENKQIIKSPFSYNNYYININTRNTTNPNMCDDLYLLTTKTLEHFI